MKKLKNLKSRKYSRTLVHGSIPQPLTPSPLYPYAQPQTSCSDRCVLDQEDQVLELDVSTPHFVMLEEMDLSSVTLVGISLVWKEEERLDLHLHPLKSLHQR